MSFSLYDREELEAIAKKEESNNKLEEFLNDKKETWSKDIQEVLDIAKLQYNAENAQKIVELQVTALVYREKIQSEISFYLQKLSKEKIKLKRAQQDKIVWYALGKSPLGIDKKVSNAHMTTIIDAHTAESARATELIEIHIDHLRGLMKQLSDLGFQVKNTIELYNLLSKN